MKSGTLERALQLALQSGDAQWVELVRVALVEKWGAYAWRQARKWHGRTKRGDLDDYRSAAQVALWEAVLRFEPERGLVFGTYAGWYLLKHLRPHAQAEAAGGFHVPDHHGFVHLVPASADEAMPGGDDATFAGTIPDHRADDPREEPPAAAELWAAVSQVLAGRGRELEVLTLRLREGLTLDAIAERWGRSKERIRQIEIRAVQRLRDRGSMFEGFLTV